MEWRRCQRYMSNLLFGRCCQRRRPLELTAMGLAPGMIASVTPKILLLFKVRSERNNDGQHHNLMKIDIAYALPSLVSMCATMKNSFSHCVPASIDQVEVLISNPSIGGLHPRTSVVAVGAGLLMILCSFFKIHSLRTELSSSLIPGHVTLRRHAFVQSPSHTNTR